jgi:hypothetical protein
MVIIPALILGLFLWKYGVDCPFMDEWDTPGFDLVQFNLGQLTGEQLFRQHNESRKFFPRLFFLYLSRFTNWNPRYGMLLSFLLACLTTFNIYYLSKQTVKSSSSQTLAYLALASMLIFSPMQWENWLWGLQMITFVLIAAITSALVIIFTPIPIIIQLLGSAALATLATFSFANGIIAWVAIFPTLYLMASKNRRSSIWVTAGWLLLFSLNGTIYFYNYHRPEHHPSFVSALTQPLDSLAYYLSFIGSPLGIHQLILNQILGLVSCLLIILIGWYFIKINQNQQLIYDFVPWLSILSYTLISGVLTTAGRVSFGVDQSLASRYITFSTYGVVALIYLLAIVAREINHPSGAANQVNQPANRYYRQPLKLFNPLVRTILMVMLLLYPLNFLRATRALSATHQERLYGKSCLTLINVVPDQACIEQYIYPRFSQVLQRVNELDRIGLIQPSLLASDRLNDISRENLPPIDYGSFDSLTKNQDNSYTASGWSVLPQYNTPAHGVILAYQTEDAIDHGFAIARPNLPTKAGQSATGKKQHFQAGWSKTFSGELIPPNAKEISAWSFDSKLARAYKIQSINFLLQGDQHHP